MNQKHEITLTIPAYNSRREGKPWIARISQWAVGTQPTLEWGAYTGDDRGGTLDIMAYPGDIIRAGQADTRNPKKSWRYWGVVKMDEDGDYDVCDTTPAKARSLYKDHVAVAAEPDPADQIAALQAQIAALQAKQTNNEGEGI